MPAKFWTPGEIRPSKWRSNWKPARPAARPASQFCVSESRVTSARLGETIGPFLQLARRRGLTAAPVLDPATAHWIGYVRVVDLYLSPHDSIGEVRPLVEISERESHLEALMRLQSEGEELARVVDSDGRTLGILFAEALTAPLLGQ